MPLGVYVAVAAERPGSVTYPFADGHCLLGHGFVVGHVVLHDGLEKLILILSVKRGLRGRDGEGNEITANQPKPPFGPFVINGKNPPSVEVFEYASRQTNARVSAGSLRRGPNAD